LSKKAFINGDSRQLKSWFCMVVLGSATNSKIVSKPPPKFIWSQAIKF